MYSFDKGRIVATTQDGLVTEFRQPQSFSADFKVNLKDLYGRGQDAIYIASGKRSIDIKGEFADITSSSMNLLLGGTKTTGINKVIDPAPVLQVPATSPYTASLGTIPNGGVLSNLMVVYDVTNAALAIPMTLITSGTPTAGQFTFDSTAVANTFTFAAADTGHNVQVLYKYNIATGTTVTLANNLMGSQKPYQLEMFTQLAGAQIHIVFPRVMSAGTSFGAKMEDFTIPSIEAKAMATVADITGYLYLDDNVAQ